MKTMLLPALALAALPAFGAGGGEPPSVKVTFGQPTIRQKLFYEKLYEKKPYPDATLYYYDNGVYKIISPARSTTASMWCTAS